MNTYAEQSSILGLNLSLSGPGEEGKPSSQVSPNEKDVAQEVSRAPFLLVQTVPRSPVRLCYSKHAAEDTEDAKEMPTK